MIIDNKLLQEIAHLARLEFNKDDEEEMKLELNTMLEWMNKLNEINTDAVEPLIHVSTEVNVLRNDEIKDSLGHNSALKNAPKKDSNYFRVPKVIE